MARRSQSSVSAWSIGILALVKVALAVTRLCKSMSPKRRRSKRRR